MGEYTHAEPTVEDAPRRRVVTPPATADLTAVRSAIGNRAFGSLLRRQRVARVASHKPRRPAPRRPPSWPELEAALADNTKDVKAIVGGVREDQLNQMWKVPDWVRKLAAAMSPERFAYLAAAIMLDSSHVPAGRKEALRLLSAMLHDKETALRMILRPVTVVIVPRDMQPTELEEFQSLLTKDEGKGPGKTFDGRQWAHVRGFSDVTYGIGVYVAIIEENLLGGAPDPKVFDAPTDDKGNAIGAKGAVVGGLPVGFSNTTHEVAHAIFRQGLTAEERKLVTRCYQAKRAATSGAGGLVANLWPDGPRINPVAPKRWKDKGWTDETRLRYLVGLSDDARRVYENYSSQNVDEYFAQLANAYVGANLGSDAATLEPRNNGRDWVASKEPKEMLDLLDRLFNHATVNDIDANGELKARGRCANPPRPPSKRGRT
jgi:hypothetical protein